jgi:hypothetical protein
MSADPSRQSQTCLVMSSRTTSGAPEGINNTAPSSPQRDTNITLKENMGYPNDSNHKFYAGAGPPHISG